MESNPLAFSARLRRLFSKGAGVGHITTTSTLYVNVMKKPCTCEGRAGNRGRRLREAAVGAESVHYMLSAIIANERQLWVRCSVLHFLSWLIKYAYFSYIFVIAVFVIRLF